jgi:hypothetical protein
VIATAAAGGRWKESVIEGVTGTFPLSRRLRRWGKNSEALRDDGICWLLCVKQAKQFDTAVFGEKDSAVCGQSWDEFPQETDDPRLISKGIADLRGRLANILDEGLFERCLRRRMSCANSAGPTITLIKRG